MIKDDTEKPKILYIATTFPALTLTFVYREIWAVELAGFSILPVSMNKPSAESVSDEAKSFLDSTLYLDQVSGMRKLASYFITMLIKPKSLLAIQFELIRFRPVKGLRDILRLQYHLIEACFLDRSLRDQTFDHIHSHFISGPTSLAMFLARLRSTTFSFTMHASLLWQDPIALNNKLQSCNFCVSISAYNKRFVLDSYGNQFDSKIHVVHCGVDAGVDPIGRADFARTDGLRIVSVAQLVPRKGFHILLPAIRAVLSTGVKIRCTIVGDGPLRTSLEELSEELKIAEHVTFTGALDQLDVQSEIQKADVFVLPCVITDDGGRDGIPVALMEAMLAEVPVVSSNILGLPELIEHETSGLLVSPDSPQDLAKCLLRLASEPDLRKRIAKGGRSRIMEEFNVELSGKSLARLFRKAIAAHSQIQRH